MKYENTKWQNTMQIYKDNKIQNETSSARAKIDNGPTEHALYLLVQQFMSISSKPNFI